MNLKSVGLAVVAIGLITFFLPLVRIQTPVLGTQQISGWDAVKPSDDKARGDDQGLLNALEKMQRDLLRQKVRESPVAIQQAQSLVVSLPLAYVSLLASAVLLLLRKSLWLRVSAAVGLFACVWSFLSVFWLSSGVKDMVAGAGGSRIPLLGRVTQSLAEKTSVSPEWGLYLLGCSLVVLLLFSLAPGKK